ncbi:MAG: right-handed parallel beta-helix repeat-containing protein, partial [Planctomycetota bacterium]
MKSRYATLVVSHHTPPIVMWSRVRQPRRRPHRGQRLRRPRFEALEDRRVLATLVVNSSDPGRSGVDDGITTFRDAIDEANSNPGLDTITFAENVSELINIGVTIRDSVVIDGGSSLVYSGGFTGQPLIELEDHFGSTIKGILFSQTVGTAIEITGGGDHTISGNVFERQEGSFGFARTGVEVIGSQGNTIGGGEASDGNVFLGLSTGIRVQTDNSVGIGVTSQQTSIEGNLIGVDAQGNPSSNTVGISIGDSQETTIRNNTISGNVTPLALDQLSRNATITGNRIGLSPAAEPDDEAAIPNASPVFAAGTFHQIDSNVISGNLDDALLISGSDITVTNNKIGTNSAGTAAIGNAGGIVIDPGNLFSAIASNNTIGPGNLIAGNREDGIVVTVNEFNPNTPDSNTIIGNAIGLNLAKDAAIPNRDGIAVRGAQNTRIEGNFIAGNSARGISVDSGRQVDGDGRFVDTVAIATTIAGNFIGTPADNANAIPNQGDG